MRHNQIWSMIWLAMAIVGIFVGTKEVFLVMFWLGSAIHSATDDILQAIERKP